MKKSTLKKLFLIFVVFNTIYSSAQITSLTCAVSDGSVITSICRDVSNTAIPVRVSYVGTELAGGVYQVYLSDAAGSFTTQTLISPTNTTAWASGTVRYFPIPVTTSGNSYKIKVIYLPLSGATVQNASTTGIPMYVKSFTNRIPIRDLNDTNLAADVTNFTICGSNLTLKISDFVPTPLSISPALTYQWFKNVSGIWIPINGQTGTTLSLTPTDVGQYYVAVNYGVCSGASSGQGASATLTIASISGLSVSVNGPSGNQFCEGTNTTLTSSLSSNTYTYSWFKKNTAGTWDAVPNPSGSTLSVAAAGTYKVVVGTGLCTVTSPDYVLNVIAPQLTITPANTNVLLPGATVNVTANINNNSATTWSWSNNSTTNNINVNTPGTYTVTASQTTPCSINKTASVTFVNPTSYKAIIAAANYTPCVSLSATINISSLTAFLNTVSYPIANPNVFSYQWYKASGTVPNPGNDLAFSTDSYVNVSNSGLYYLLIAFSNGQQTYSDPLLISLKTNETISIDPSGGLCTVGSSVALNSSLQNIPSGQNINSYTYVWKKDGNVLPQTTANINVTDPGVYTITAKNAFNCTVSASYTLNPTLISDITFSRNPGSIYLPPNSTLNITSTGGSAYIWSQIIGTNTVFISNTANVNITQAGLVKAKVTLGQCIFEFDFNIVSRPISGSESVSNLITPNNDSFNDTWQLPDEVLKKGNVAVEIYDNLGKKIYQTDNYLNDWPSADFTSYNTNAVYYYIITPTNQEPLKGTITLLK